MAAVTRNKASRGMTNKKRSLITEDRGRKSLSLAFMIVDCIVPAGDEMRGVTYTGCLYHKKEHVMNYHPL